MMERRYYLDWLRVFAVILLVPFHSGMIFADEDFHIKNDVTSTGITIINAFIDNWHMPLFFLLAGAATWLALSKRKPMDYMRERFSRLIIPLIFGMMVVVPPQTFFERIQKSGFSGNYFEFYSHLFNGIYPRGNLTWNHLWFLLYLFLISLAVLPLVWRWKTGCASFLTRGYHWLAEGPRIFLLAVPLAVIQMTLKVAFPGPQNIVTDWARMLFMAVIFLYGVLFCKAPIFMDSVDRNLRSALVLGTAFLIFFIALELAGYRFVFGYNLPYMSQLGIKALGTFCWLIVLLGFFYRNFNFSNQFLAKTQEIALPFYILHQTIIIMIGYYIIATNYSWLVKYIIINVSAFIATAAICEAIVKRIRILRLLFGMRGIQHHLPYSKRLLIF